MDELVDFETAQEYLLAESQFLEEQCGVDPDLLGSHWAEHMLQLKWPRLTGNDVSYLLQGIGWH